MGIWTTLTRKRFAPRSLSQFLSDSAPLLEILVPGLIFICLPKGYLKDFALLGTLSTSFILFVTWVYEDIRCTHLASSVKRRAQSPGISQRLHPQEPLLHLIVEVLGLKKLEGSQDTILEFLHYLGPRTIELARESIENDRTTLRVRILGLQPRQPELYHQLSRFHNRTVPRDIDECPEAPNLNPLEEEFFRRKV